MGAAGFFPITGRGAKPNAGYGHFTGGLAVYKHIRPTAEQWVGSRNLPAAPLYSLLPTTNKALVRLSLLLLAITFFRKGGLPPSGRQGQDKSDEMVGPLTATLTNSSGQKKVMARKRKKQKASFAIQSMFEEHVTYFDQQGHPIGKPKPKKAQQVIHSPQTRLL